MARNRPGQPHPALTAALLALATHRITRLIVADHILDRPRAIVQDWAEGRHTSATACDGTSCGRPEGEWHHPLAYLLSCAWCASCHVATALVAALAASGRRPAHPVLTVLAASTVTGLLAGHEES